MTQTETDQLKRLFKLATIAQEMEFVDFKTVDHFNTLREQHGISHLIILIQEYATSQANKVRAQTFETANTNQNPSPVQ